MTADQSKSTLIDQLSLLVTHILRDYKKNDLAINLKLVSSDEMVSLNQTYRKKTKDTNVLSFPADPGLQEKIEHWYPLFSFCKFDLERPSHLTTQALG